MSSQRRAGVFLGYVNIIVKNLVNLVYTPMLLSFVGEADYGVYQTSYSFVFSLSLLTFGFSQAYVRFYTQKKAHGEDVRQLNGVYLVFYAAASIVAFLLGLAFSASAGTIFSSSFTADEVGLAQAVMSIMAASIAVTLFTSVFDAYVLAHEEFRFRQSRQLVTTLVTPFAAYTLLCLGMGVVGVAVTQLAINIALLALNAGFCLGRLKMRFDVRRFDVPLFRSIAVFSTWIFVDQICGLVNQNIPNVLLGVFTSASAVAVFAVSVQIRNVFVSLSTVISSVFIPKINRIVANTDDNFALTQLMTGAGRYQMMLFCWVYGGFIIFGRYFIAQWAGPGFIDAYWLVLVMTLPLVLPLTQNTGIEIQRAKNMHKPRSVATLLGAVFNIIITCGASPFVGYWAPAIGFVVSIALCNGVFMNWYYQKKVGLDMFFFWRRNLPVFLLGVLIVAPCLAGTSFVPVDGYLSFFVWGVVYTAFFGVAMWFAVLDRQERALILSLVHSNKNRS